MRVPHGRRWSWRPPFLLCRCGLRWRACVAEQRQERAEIAQALYDDGVAAAQEWQREERRRRADGLR